MMLRPILPTLPENAHFVSKPYAESILSGTIDFFNKIGYNPPWIGYFVQIGDDLVGGAAFKGKPINGRVEIAYGVEPNYQHQGIGTAICWQLVELALQTDATVTVTARTLPEENYSTRILAKNNFVFCGTVWDEEDGEVWEWEYCQPNGVVTR